MRTISADADAILRGARKFRARVSVKDNGGTFRDLTTYAGSNLLLSVTWREGVDDPGITWEASLVREEELNSLAPLMQTSGLNRGFDISNSYSPLLQVGRQMKLEWALQAEDDPTSLIWILAFTGYLDSVKWGGDSLVALSGRGEQAPLINCYIERERLYAYAQGAHATKGVYIWTPDTVWVVGQLVCPTDSKTNEHFYRVTTAGTGGSSEPTWPTGGSSTVADGGAVFTESGATSTSAGTPVETVIQQLLNDNLAAPPTLQVPASPGWDIKWFKIGRQILFDELRLLADQLGWCIRHLYDGSGADFTLYDPDRANTTSMRTFEIGDVNAVSNAEIEIFNIRNVWQAVFSDSQDLDASGNPKRKTVSVSNSTSIAKYGRLFAEIGEASTSNIDTTAEALVMITAALEDTREPDADFEIETPLFPFVEVTDLYTLAANGVHFDVDEKLAVVGYEHTHSAADSVSKIRLRGRPSSAHSKWRQRSTDAYNGDVHSLTVKENPNPPILTVDETVIGGALLTLDFGGGSKSGHRTSHELHLSEVSGFVPDSSTLVATGPERTRQVGNLDPAKTYYGKVVPITSNAERPVRGEPSEQVVIIPGRAQATHLNPEVSWRRIPLNGGFESSLDPSGPPDFWTLIGAGTPVWGVDASLATSGGLEGGGYLKITPSGSTKAPSLTSAVFPINELRAYSASFWRKAVLGGTDLCTLGIQWLDSAQALISATSESFALNDSVGTWVLQRLGSVSPPSGARFARLNVFMLNSATTKEAHIDSVEFDVDERWHTVGAAAVPSLGFIAEPAYANSWVAHTAGTNDLQFRREGAGLGWCAMRGAVKSGSSATATIFTLPAGYRPLRPVVVPIASNGAYGELTISTAGVVAASVGNTTKLSLDGVRFPLD